MSTTVMAHVSKIKKGATPASGVPKTPKSKKRAPNRG